MKSCDECKYYDNSPCEYPCQDCDRENNHKNFKSLIVSKMEDERDKVNAEGEMVYSKSEIEVFNKCIRIFQGEE